MPRRSPRPVRPPTPGLSPTPRPNSWRQPLAGSSLPAARAIESDGVRTGRDYRGAEVLTASQHVNGVPWVVVTKNGRPVAKIMPQSGDRTDDPEWQANFAALKESLRSKRGSGFRVGTIAEDDKYGDDAA